MTQEINLLGPQFRRSRRSVISAAVLGPALLLPVALGLAAGFVVRQQARELTVRHADNDGLIQRAQDEQRKLAQAVSQIRSDPGLEAELAALEKRLLAVQLDLAALDNGAIGDTRGFSDFMRALAHQGIEGVWLTGFNVGAAGKEISISGRALRPELVPAYLKRLGQDPYFAGRSFAALDVAQPRNEARAEGARTNTALAFNLMSRLEQAASAARRDLSTTEVAR